MNRWMILRLFIFFIGMALSGLGLVLNGVANAASPAETLKSTYLTLEPVLSDNPFYQESREGEHSLQGDVYGVVNYPLDHVRKALDTAAAWCEIAILHINVTHCTPGSEPQKPTLVLQIEKKTGGTPVFDSTLRYNFHLAAAHPGYVQIILTADEGPLGTRDYRMILEAVAVSSDKTFLHFSYSYGYGFQARTATAVYLATLGRKKIGFTVIGHDAKGDRIYIDGVRGVMERNTVRYFLAIRVHLGALHLPPEQRFERGIQDWFAATERYPRQLHEMDKESYLAAKRQGRTTSGTIRVDHKE